MHEKIHAIEFIPTGGGHLNRLKSSCVEMSLCLSELSESLRRSTEHPDFNGISVGQSWCRAIQAIKGLESAGLITRTELGGRIRHVEYDLVEPVRLGTYRLLDSLAEWRNAGWNRDRP